LQIIEQTELEILDNSPSKTEMDAHFINKLKEKRQKDRKTGLIVEDAISKLMANLKKYK
jgi:hypothetical protein